MTPKKMTPKEKALELTEKMAIHHWTDVCDYEGAKQCALIAAYETLNMFSEIHKHLVNGDVIKGELVETATYQYWQEVKQEIEKL